MAGLSPSDTVFRDLVLSNLNFNRVKFWVRVHGFPLSHLDVEWGIQALRHVEIVVRIDGGYQDVPKKSRYSSSSLNRCL